MERLLDLLYPLRGYNVFKLSFPERLDDEPIWATILHPHSWVRKTYHDPHPVYHAARDHAYHCYTASSLLQTFLRAIDVADMDKLTCLVEDDA